MIPGTDNRVSVCGMDFYKIASGRIAEHWDVIDEAGLMARFTGAKASVSTAIAL